MKRLRTVVLTAVALATAVVPLALTQGAQAAPSPTVVSITFDDTYADTMPALDAMLARGIPGTLYVNSQRIGFSSQFMTRNQLKGYADAGFEIGGHTLNHEDLTTLPIEQAKDNVCRDRANLINLGYRPKSFAYPFGANDPAIQQAVKDCGYNSARITSDLRNAPVSCLKCPVAESIPPRNTYEVRTPSTVRDSTTLDQMKGYVIAAEEGGGGWVPLVFHHICTEASCTGNVMNLSTFTEFLDWMKTRPATTQVKTVDGVVNGPFIPLPPDDEDPVPDIDSVLVNGTKSHVVDGVNAKRMTNQLIVYTRVAGTTSGANQYGTEVQVTNGKATLIQSNVGNMAIPPGDSAHNFVLSGHGTSATWLKQNVKVGDTVVLPDVGTPPPPPPPPPAGLPKTSVTIGSASHAVTGTNVYRGAQALVVYTPEHGATTGANEFGFEAAVVDGKVTLVQNGVGNMAIPTNGYVLSGHGESRTWLRNNATAGASVAGN